MTRRVFIVYGWGGHPEDAWLPWLKKELESHGFEVHIPRLPDADHPRIDMWVSTLAKAVGTPDECTYFVGHSMGCQTIVRYVQSLGESVETGGAVFVAGFFRRLTGMGDGPESKATQDHWLNAPVNLEEAKKRLSKSIAVFSDDDPYVPIDNIADFRDILGSKIIIEHGKGHYSGQRDATTELPIVLECVLEIAA